LGAAQRPALTCLAGCAGLDPHYISVPQRAYPRKHSAEGQIRCSLLLGLCFLVFLIDIYKIIPYGCRIIYSLECFKKWRTFLCKHRNDSKYVVLCNHRNSKKKPLRSRSKIITKNLLALEKVLQAQHMIRRKMHLPS
jgi:hypothetical protein